MEKSDALRLKPENLSRDYKATISMEFMRRLVEV